MVAKTLGELTQEYRKAHRISMRKFAQMCGVSKSYISVLENNWSPTTGKEPVPSLDVILAVAKAMDTDPLKLMKKMGMDIKPETQPPQAAPKQMTKIRPFQYIPPTRENLQAALTEGRLLILPFRALKEGDVVYLPVEGFGAVASTVTKVEGGFYHAFSEINGTTTFSLYDIGNTVFLSRSDASKAKNNNPQEPTD